MNEPSEGNVVTEPVALVLNYNAFSAISIEKKKLLFEIKKRTASQVVDNENLTVTWFFEPEVFLDVVKEYPWLLDKNLGEKEVEDAHFGFGYSNP